MSKDRCLVIGCGAEDSSYGNTPKDGIIALDNSFEILKKYKDKEPSILAVTADAQHLPFKQNSFSSVQATHVIEHLPEADSMQTISEISRIAKTDAIITLATPHPIFEKVMTVINAKHHSAVMHQQVVDMKQLINLTTDSNLEIIDSKAQRWQQAIKLIITAFIHKLRPSTISFHEQIGFVSTGNKNKGVNFAKEVINNIIGSMNFLSPILNKILPYENIVIAKKV